MNQACCLHATVRTATILRSFQRRSSRVISSSTKENEEGSRKSAASRQKKIKKPLIPPLSEFLKEQEAVTEQRRRQSARDVASIFGTSTAQGGNDSIFEKREVESAARSATEGSLFEVFKIPDAPPPRSESAFELDAFNSYLELLENLMVEDHKFMRRHTAKPIPDELANPIIEALRSVEPLVPINIPAFETSLEDGTTVPREEAMQQVMLQRRRFKEEMGFSDLQYTQYEGILHKIANVCAQRAKGLPATIIWAKMKEAGSRKQRALHNMLYVTSTFTSGSSAKRRQFGKHIGMSSIADLLSTSPYPSAEGDTKTEESLVDITDELAIFHDLLYEPTEQSVLTRVRLLVAQGNAEMAEKLLLENEKEFHLRAYLPVLRLHVEQDNMSKALRLYHHMRALPTVHFEAETYIHLIAGLAEKGHLHSMASPIEDIVTPCSFDSMSGPELFNYLAGHLADDILDLPLPLAKRLYNATASGFPEANLPQAPPLAPVPLADTLMNCRHGLIATRVIIDPSTGRCPHSQIKLRLIGLNGEQQQTFRDNLLELARVEQIKFSEQHNYEIKEKAVDQLEKFMAWMDKRKGRPFTVIIDGPNVGYYLQNFDGGRFSYHQLELVVESLESMGENPLIILPRKYANDRINVTLSVSQMRLTSAEKRIRNKLIKTGKIYLVPPGHLDDYFWMMSSLSQQTNSRKGRDLSVVPQQNTKCRWPGIRPIIISNDQMRDHRLELIEPRLFRRWYSNYIVHYNFIAFVNDGNHRDSLNEDIGFNPADFFSREIQSNREHGDSEPVWHFPIEGTEDEWLVISLPTGDTAN